VAETQTPQLPTCAPDDLPNAPAANGPALPSLGTYLCGVALLASAYYLGAQVGFLTALLEHQIVFIWPPAGIAVAVLFRSGLRYWPGVFLGAAACELPQFPWWVAVGLAAGNTIGPVISVVLLQRFRFDPEATGRRALYALLLACVAGMTVSASNGVIWRAAGGLASNELIPTWLMWWLGDTAGLLVVAPPLLTAPDPRRARAAVPMAGWLSLTAALSALAFTDVVPIPVRGLLVFLPLMLLIWIGMTERLRVGSLHVLVLVAIAVTGTASGQGIFGDLAPIPKLLVLWALATTAALIVLAMTTTLAERERAEAALAAHAAEYQALVDSTPAAIVRYTADGTLTFVNETLCKLLELPRRALLGRSILEFIPQMPLTEQVTDLPVGQPMNGPGSGVSGAFRRADGSIRWYRWTARRINTTLGVEFQAVGIDLTERRQAEAERVAIERKMQDAQRLEALGVLAGGVAHDFNNLLAGVLGHAELAALALPEDHPARDHLAIVMSGVAQAGGLTRQLLAYSGKGRFLLRSLDLNDLIRQTTELLRLTLPKKVHLNLQLADRLPSITGDDGQLRQVLMNLIINAGEAIGDRAGTVTVVTESNEIFMEAVSGSVYSPAAPGRFVELIVADNGCGMDDATKGKLFDPFFTTKFAGRGLGMSAVLGIIRGHGGGIRVESRPGVGSRFTVLLPAAGDVPCVTTPTPPPVGNLLSKTPTLPLPIERVRRSGSIAAPAARSVAATSSSPTPTRAPAAPPASGAGHPARRLALVADDEPTVRQVGELMLQQLGFDVVTATNGQEAVAAFEAHADRIRLVLLDLMMPVMDGTEALAMIRARSGVPVILCSGYTSEAVPEDLAADAATAFLQKPFARAELRAALCAVGA
jgi:PAS domain S-box-containing protein